MPYYKTEAKNLKAIAKTMKQLLFGYDTASTHYRRYQMRSLERMCRFLEFLMSPRISERAAKEAKNRNLNLDHLRETKWSNQAKRLSDPQRKIFHFEHVVPNTQLANQIREVRNRPVGEIEKLLKTAEIAWILKKEDKKLSANGHRSKRADPRACYEKAGIKLLED